MRYVVLKIAVPDESIMRADRLMDRLRRYAENHSAKVELAFVHDKESQADADLRSED